MKQWGRGPEALARFMTSETFGVYGKENRQMLGRGFGSLPALFMTYMTQMLGLMYRMLNPPIIKKNPIGRGYRIEVMDTSKTKAQNAMGRKAFARIMLMMLITGGVFGLPGGEDAEDAYDIIKKTITGVESDLRTEFRNMLYEAGWGPGMIESLEKGLVSYDKDFYDAERSEQMLDDFFNQNAVHMGWTEETQKIAIEFA